MVPAILFVLGASGAGKTSALEILEGRRLPSVSCYHFDSIGVPSAAVMEREWGSGERWQEQMTQHWIDRLAANSDGARVGVLEGQTRPSYIEPYASRLGVRHYRIVLLDCLPAVRATRLHGPRAQPELASPRMDAWAAYLRGQADALGLAVVDTSSSSVEQVADGLQELIEELREAAGAAA